MKTYLREKDFQAGLLTALFGVAGWLYTHATVTTSNSLVASGIAADFYPKCLFGALVLCGLFLMYQSFMKLPEERQTFPRTDWKSVIITFVLMFAYAFLLDIAGFIISSILFMFVFMLFLGERNWKTLILVPVLGSIGVFLVFGKLFMIALPTIWL